MSDLKSKFSFKYWDLATALATSSYKLSSISLLGRRVAKCKLGKAENIREHPFIMSVTFLDFLTRFPIIHISVSDQYCSSTKSNKTNALKCHHIFLKEVTVIIHLLFFCTHLPSKTNAHVLHCQAGDWNWNRARRMELQCSFSTLLATDFINSA